MEQKNQAVATHFAEYLVGSMLQRSGADFLHAQPAQGGAADFLVRNGDLDIPIEVKYTADSQNVSEIWKEWLSRTDDEFSSPHLVIVTGAGETVFTDATTARFLGPDHRTTLAILRPAAEGQKRTPIGASQ